MKLPGKLINPVRGKINSIIPNHVSVWPVFQYIIVSIRGWGSLTGATVNPFKDIASWAQEHHVTLAHIQPGKPAQNAYIDRFNRTFREDVLDAYLFSSLEEVRQIADAWMEEYNLIRPHEALQGMSPYQFATHKA